MIIIQPEILKIRRMLHPYLFWLCPEKSRRHAQLFQDIGAGWNSLHIMGNTACAPEHLLILSGSCPAVCRLKTEGNI